LKIKWKNKKARKQAKQQLVFVVKIKTYLYKKLVQRFVIKKNSQKNIRFLEIGPGVQRLADFETVNVLKNDVTDYIADLSLEKLPFKDRSFDLIYTSHFLEHIEWFKVEQCIKEMHRVLKDNGKLEIWLPDGLKAAQTLIEAENGRLLKTPDGWKNGNKEDSPYLWVNGRVFYGLNPKYPSWHKGLFTYNYLASLLEKSKFKNIRKLDNKECRGFDHGWINLGIIGEK
jgi:SAM-dependent methyltransferase